jgi:hypothetical protein
MKRPIDRREFLKLAGLGGVVFASGLRTAAQAAGEKTATEDFYFVQLSDTHWGFEGPPNPDAKGRSKGGRRGQCAVAAAGLRDVHRRSDAYHGRRERTQAASVRVSRDRRGSRSEKRALHARREHDASLDRGEAYQELFGKTHYAFDHKGVHFIVLDNVSDPAAMIGEEQLLWLAADLKQLPANANIVVFTHRPLFDLYPQWDWATRDGAKAVELLMPNPNVTVFYGHIHQEHHHMTGHIGHHAAKGLMFALPAPGSQPKRAPVPWDAAQPYKDLGFRSVDAQPKKPAYQITELPVQKGPDMRLEHRVAMSMLAIVVGAWAAGLHVAAAPADQVIRVAARKFDFAPNAIVLKNGVPVVLEFTTADVVMGFSAPDLGTRADILPGKDNTGTDRPRQDGSFAFSAISSVETVMRK